MTSRTPTISKFPELEPLKLVSRECLFSQSFKEDTGPTLILLVTNALEFLRETQWDKTAQTISLERLQLEEEDLLTLPKNQDHLRRLSPNKFPDSTNNMMTSISEDLLLLKLLLFIKHPLSHKVLRTFKQDLILRKSLTLQGSQSSLREQSLSYANILLEMFTTNIRVTKISSVFLLSK